MRMGGRAAELLVYGDLSTGASNDLVGNTELARKMVREWGMSEELGPMAWGSQGMVFLGEDLLHSRDYSEDTARVVDAEIARILRQQEERAIELLSRHRGGLDAVARALLERETLDGSEVGKLVDTAYGRPVHDAAVMASHFTTTNGSATKPEAGLSGNGADSEMPGDRSRAHRLDHPAPTDSSASSTPARRLRPAGSVPGRDVRTGLERRRRTTARPRHRAPPRAARRARPPRADRLDLEGSRSRRAARDWAR